MNELRKIGPVFLLLGTLLFAACGKTEFLPDPEGRQIPFQPAATQTVEQLLAASPAKLYYAAWERSNIKNILKAKGEKLMFTAFVPTDAAMQAAGLTSTVIGQMPVAELDSLMMFSLATGTVTADDLRSRDDNYIAKSMLPHPGLYVNYYEGHIGDGLRYDDYYYRHYVGINNDNLLVNGKSMGKLNYLPATNGGIYLMEKSLEKPLKTMLETLKADGRFTMFLESQRLADEMFVEKIISDMEPLFGYRPDPSEVRMNYSARRKFYEKDWGVNPPQYPGYVGPNLTVSTLFAPTNEAFHKAGFQTVADILKFNEERGNVWFDDLYYEAKGGYPMDSIFNYHRNWGRLNQLVTEGGDKTADNATVFYSNVLNPVLNNYIVNVGGNPPIEYSYKMPLEFSLNNNRIQLKVKGSEYPAATVIDRDINTLNGPIHVVDQLLIPKGFKLK